MNIKTKLVISAALLALLSAPASARIDGDDSAASAYADYNRQHSYTPDAASSYASGYTVQPRDSVQPRYNGQRQQHLQHPQPRR